MATANSIVLTLAVHDNFFAFKKSSFQLFTSSIIVAMMLSSSTTTAMPAATTGAEEQLLPQEYLAAPSPSVTDLQVMSVSTDWAAADLGYLSPLCSSPPEQQIWPPRCNYSVPKVENDTPLEKRSACRWDYVVETDPLRIPQQIRHARCSCFNCQMQRINPPFYTSGCEEQFATFPVIRCQEALTSDISLNQTCRMVMQRVAVGCVCAFVRPL